MFIPDPGIKRFRIRIRIKEFKYFLSKKLCPSSRNYDPGCSSRIRIPDQDLDFLPVPRIQGSKRQRIPDIGSGSETLQIGFFLFLFCYLFMFCESYLVFENDLSLSLLPGEESPVGWLTNIQTFLKQGRAVNLSAQTL
jgi:hypothetical protein